MVAADLTAPGTLPAALDGVRRVFAHSTPNGMADFAEAADRAGVEHVVLLSSGSVLLASARGNAIAEEHRLVERALADSGLRLTPIRPLVPAGNAMSWSHSIRVEGVVRPVHPDAVSAPVHERDIAAVAVTASRGADEQAVSAMPTGPDLLTQRQQVELIAHATARPVRVLELSEEDGRGHLERFLPRHFAGAVLDFPTTSLADGPLVTTTANDVLGRAPAPFAQRAREHAADFR